MSNRKVYDCFTFFNELDLLEIRLNVLNPYVDFFVLVESTLTFRGNAKPLFYLENKERFKSFQSKIRHIVVDTFPESRADWVLETHQRNQIEHGIKDALPDDVILISDLDEIPNPKLIKAKSTSSIESLKQKIYYGYLNGETNHTSDRAKIMLRKDMQVNLDSENLYSRYLPEISNQGTTISKIRMHHSPVLEEAGWHFSYLGSYEDTIYKIESYSHSENDTVAYKSVENISKIMEKVRYVPIDHSFPEYIHSNQDKLSKFIKP